MPVLNDNLDTVSARVGSIASLNTAQERQQFLSAVQADVSAIAFQLNNVSFLLHDKLSKVVGLDALDFGLSGNIIFTHINATAADASAYWDSTNSRARTIKETTDVLLSEISRVENTVLPAAVASAYDDGPLTTLVNTNTSNLTQLRKDSMGANYTLDNDAAANLTFSVSQAVDAIGAFFTSFPGTGNTYVPTYPTLTLAQSAITDLTTHLTAMRIFTGMDAASDSTPDYTAHGTVTVVSDGDSLELAIQKLDVSTSANAFSTTSGVTSNSIGAEATDDFVFGSPSLDDDTDTTHDSRFLFDKSKGAFRAGSTTLTAWDDALRGLQSVAFGLNTIATGDQSGVLSGEDNDVKVAATHGFIGGGKGNVVGDGINAILYAAVAGGLNNTALSEQTFIGGGSGNTAGIAASPTFGSAFIGAGESNTVYGRRNFIGAGQGNTTGITGVAGIGDSAVVAGTVNKVETGSSFIGAGNGNNIVKDTGASDFSAIVCGQTGNIDDATWGFLGTGKGNTLLTADFGVIVGGGLAATGNGNLISGSTNGFIGNGSNCDITGGSYNTVLNGNTNIITAGTGVVILNGSENRASASYSSVQGLEANADQYGTPVQASGQFSAVGDAQAMAPLWRIVTTTDTADVEMFLDGASERFTIPTDTTCTFDLLFAARRTDVDNESAGYRVTGVADNNAGVTALVNVVVKQIYGEDVAGWDVTVEADDTNDALVPKVTGALTSNIRWVASGRVVRVTG